MKKDTANNQSVKGSYKNMIEVKNLNKSFITKGGSAKFSAILTLTSRITV